jgi:hypothetical protein
MLRLELDVLVKLREGQAFRHIDRIDKWLQAEVPEWSQDVLENRYAVIRSTLGLAHASGISNLSDLALLAKLSADLGSHRERFFSHTKVQDVLSWEVENQGAKIFELYRLAEPIVLHFRDEPRK